MTTFTESLVEQTALTWLKRFGGSVRHGLEIAPGEPGAERFRAASCRKIES